MHRYRVTLLVSILSCSILDVFGATAASSKQLGNLGHFKQWSTIEVGLIGPHSKGRGQPNPFAIRVHGVFTHASGQTFEVPGFYDGNGTGGLDGSVWKIRFSAEKPGQWRFVTRSSDKRLHDYAGSFTVGFPDNDAADFYRWGRLESVSTATNRIRYLKFREGPYWLKAGCDDPENFLGSYRNYDTLQKRKVAIDYLSGKGINSLYIMTHNIGGDDKDVWPWLGNNASAAKRNGGRNARFDVRKLHEWRKLFEYMQAKGVVVYLVLEDDSAWKAYDHARYYRELIARFGDLPALVFNFNEEHNENYSLSEALEFMRLLQTIDPYDHPRGIHNVNRVDNQYIDASSVDFTAIQTGKPGSLRDREKALAHNRTAVDWIERCVSRNKRILMIGFDEGRPEEDRRAWWSAYMGGAVWEAHVLDPYDRPMSAWDATWTQLGGTRTFMESLPFWEMQPSNHLIKSGIGFCLANPGSAYAVYLPDNQSITIELQQDIDYETSWWKAANGRDDRFQDRQTVTGGLRGFTPPNKGDWALRIVRKK